jgi:hypothetical protein
MTFGDAATLFRKRLDSDGSLKPRSKEYRRERYDNPARFIKRVRVRAKELHLPSHEDFLRPVECIEKVNQRHSQDCTDLVRFLAFGKPMANNFWIAPKLFQYSVELSRYCLTTPGHVVVEHQVCN